MMFRDPQPGDVLAATGGVRPVYAIGNFDGAHRGHQALFATAVRVAGAAGAVPGALTFDPHPARVFNPDLAPPMIMTLPRRVEAMGEYGVEVAVVQSFDRAFAGTSPEAFVNEVLHDRFGAGGVVVGVDFNFGAKRAGNVRMLRELCGAQGMSVSVVSPVTAGDIVVSSTKVREFVLEGRMAGARLLLGRPFELAGTVVTGAGRGTGIGVPTANLACEDAELQPRGGVYAAEATLADGSRHAAAVNIGMNPTFGENTGITVEAHLVGFEGDLLGQRVRLAFLERLRAERRFESVDALVVRIKEDVATAAEVYRDWAAKQ